MATMLSDVYVHGYDPRENERLHDQAATLVDLLHCDTTYPSGSTVLEVGCGVGAQTVTLARQSPDARFTSIDISAESIAEAKRRIDHAGLTNVEFRQADIFALPWEPDSFDHVFVCFVLEHLSRPVEALALLSTMLKPNGTITVIEGDHGSTYFHPDSAAARAAIQCQVTLQEQAGGNSLIGRQLHPLMDRRWLRGGPRLTPDGLRRREPPRPRGRLHAKNVHRDDRGIREPALSAGLIDPAGFDMGVRDLHRTAEADGVFCYTFFKGVAAKPRHA